MSLTSLLRPAIALPLLVGVAVGGAGCASLYAEPGTMYPDGVDPPTPTSVVYPPGIPLPDAIGDFLARAVERGADWVSELAFTTLTEPTCSAPLLPVTVSERAESDHLVRDNWSDSYRVETRAESVEVPFLRAIDDVDTILQDVEIWTSNQPRGCVVEPQAALEISAGLHGRKGIGVRAGPARLDLTHQADVDPGEPTAPL